MKKLLKRLMVVSLLLLTSIITLGCVNVGETNTATDQQIEKTGQKSVEVTITLSEGGKSFSKKKVSVPENETLAIILDENYTVKSDKGMITSLEGRSQIPDENKYWLFDVNGKSSTVGAESYKVQAGDKIDWKLDQLN